MDYKWKINWSIILFLHINLCNYNLNIVVSSIGEHIYAPNTFPWVLCSVGSMFLSIYVLLMSVHPWVLDFLGSRFPLVILPKKQFDFHERFIQLFAQDILLKNVHSKKIDWNVWFCHHELSTNDTSLPAIQLSKLVFRTLPLDWKDKKWNL